MESRLDWLNALPREEAERELLRCCGAHRWGERMLARRPFADTESLLSAADEICGTLERKDWLEAFSHHPRIGGDDAQENRFAATRSWSSGEQAGVDGADASVRHRLGTANDAYYERFGYVFLICATGRNVTEMLAEAQRRLLNDPDTELQVAAEQQRRITRLRLSKLLAS